MHPEAFEESHESKILQDCNTKTSANYNPSGNSKLNYQC